MVQQCFGDGPFVFRINDNGTGPHLLSQVCLERGWKEFSGNDPDSWNLWWRTSGFPVAHHRNLTAGQFINHIPKGSAICRKDNLVRYLRCMKKVYGAIYDFSPQGFNLPLEYIKLATECSKGRLYHSRDELEYGYYDERPVWICKPVAQSQGRGIFLFRKLSELNCDNNIIVQRYIERPLLIGGYKFDLRLYVCIPSYHPVTIYLYREGLARFGTDKFSLNDLRNPFRHLTNCSINKLGPGYTEMKERIGSGCKWTLKQLRRHFKQVGIEDWLLWQQISSLIVLTLLSHLSQVPPTVNCFEFFGFDVLIDEQLKPWLIEVNLSPALSNDCDVDSLVKKPMLHDMFDLLGLPIYNTGLGIYDLWNDDVKENDSSDVNNDEYGTGAKMAALTAAGRWRKRYKKSSSKSASSRSKSRTRSECKQKDKHKNCNGVDGVRVNINDQFYNSKSYEQRRVSCAKMWGNGKDWKNAPDFEGDWIRVWPFSLGSNFTDSVNGKGNVKQMVSEIIKFNKVSKDVMKKYQSASEAQRCEYLQQELDWTRDVWIPPI